MIYQHPWYSQLTLLENTTNSESESTQKQSTETVGQKSTKVCTHCKQELPLDSFNKHPHGPLGRDHRCKSCQNEASKWKRRAEKNAPPRPDKCDCCGVEGKQLVPDHIRGTDICRGWLCNNCNKSIGAFGDTLEGVMNAVNYLTKTDDLLKQQKRNQVDKEEDTTG